MVWNLKIAQMFENVSLIPVDFTAKENVFLRLQPLEYLGDSFKIGYLVQYGKPVGDSVLDFLVKIKSESLYGFSAIAIDSNHRYDSYSLEIKLNNVYSQMLLELWEWEPREYLFGDVVNSVSSFQELLPIRKCRTNWYLENQGEYPLVFKWGENGNEWELKPGKYISGESGKNKSLFVKGESTCEFIESWEE